MAWLRLHSTENVAGKEYVQQKPTLPFGCCFSFVSSVFVVSEVCCISLGALDFVGIFYKESITTASSVPIPSCENHRSINAVKTIGPINVGKTKAHECWENHRLINSGRNIGPSMLREP